MSQGFHKGRNNHLVSMEIFYKDTLHIRTPMSKLVNIYSYSVKTNTESNRTSSPVEEVLSSPVEEVLTCWGGRAAPSQVSPRPGCARSVQPPPCLSCWTQPFVPPAPGSEQTHQCQPLSAWQSQGYTRTNPACCGALCNEQTKVELPMLS